MRFASSREPYTPVQSRTTSTPSSRRGAIAVNVHAIRGWRHHQQKLIAFLSYFPCKTAMAGVIFHKCAMPAASASSLIATTVISPGVRIHTRHEPHYARCDRSHYRYAYGHRSPARFSLSKFANRVIQQIVRGNLTCRKLRLIVNCRTFNRLKRFS